MIFTINAVKIIFPTHRLKNDGEFRNIEKENESNVLDNDMTFSSYNSADLWLERNKTVTIDGQIVETKPESFGLTDTTIELMSHRTEKPKREFITKEELKETLLAGDDNYTNVLTIDWDGNLHLTPFNQLRFKNDCAVRLESFGAGNGYVGSTSFLNHFENTYLSLLEAWLWHLNSEQNQYKDDPANKTEEQLLKEIKETYNNL
ncbi:hypothetical protein CWR48_15760 [Oceanobacillus arenosus]|uniref:Uncharacterized protein n=1 Tax=Oceanobacillus arenosus TaxID=1229153 RepID=A0A3D8PMP3_9BACI|nr:hypothetical protein [Oceanobacillus arenosus]RDW16501.1 hypothetical protein CWR48_15760 [Oceanobacillus arenosus]